MTAIDVLGKNPSKYVVALLHVLSQVCCIDTVSRSMRSQIPGRRLTVPGATCLYILISKAATGTQQLYRAVNLSFSVSIFHRIKRESNILGLKAMRQ